MAKHLGDGGGLSRDGVLTIEVDLKNIEACQEAAELLHTGVLVCHGMAAADKVFAKARSSKQQMKENINIRLLCEVEEILTRGASVEHAAAELAKMNESLPRNERHGPSGTTSPSTMATHIRRLTKRYAGTTKLATAQQTLRELKSKLLELKSRQSKVAD